MTDCCHLCASPLTDAIEVSRESRTGPLLTVACRRCSLVQTVPHATPEEVLAYYASGQYRREFPDLPRPWLDEDGKPSDPLRHVNPGDTDYALTLDRHAQHAARRLWRTLGLWEDVSVLEVGCGDGRIAAELARMGAKVHAVEADPEKLAEARTRLADVYQHAESDAYDVVYALQVIEHFSRPVPELCDMVRHAKKGGIVYVEVPTVEKPYGSLAHFLQRPHTVNYSTHTLAAALTIAGLDEVQTELDGSVLCGIGLRSEEGTRAYRTHGGPSALEVVGRLHAWERQRAEAETAERRVNDFLNPKWRVDACARADGVDAGTLDTLNFVADEFIRWRKMATNAGYSLAKLCVMLEEAERPDWHVDPWVRGFYAGRIYEGQRLGSALAHINNGLTLDLNRRPK